MFGEIFGGIKGMWNNKPIIKKIKLANFKCHALFEEEFKGMTILAGENSAGKSSIIQSILLFEKATECNDDRNAKLFTLNVNGINLGTALSIVNENSGSDYTDLQLYFDEENYEYVQLAIDETDDANFIISKKSEFKPKYQLFYINAERLGPRAYNDISSAGSFYVGTHGENTIYVISQVNNIIKRKEDTEEMLNWNKMNGTELELKSFLGSVEKCLQRIIPGTRLNIEANTNQGTASIRYSNGMGHEVIPTATGFGITYALPIITQALVSLLFSNSILIVENPEAHLHPFSQSQLGRFLAEISVCGVQVIVETHSEHFINGCRLRLAELKKNDNANILFFSRTIDDSENLQTNHTVISIDEAGELSAWPRGFFDQSERDLFEVVKNKCKK